MRLFRSKESGHPTTPVAIVSDILMKRHGIPYQQATKLAYRTIKEKIWKIGSGAWLKKAQTKPKRRRMDATSAVHATSTSKSLSPQSPTYPTNTNTGSLQPMIAPVKILNKIQCSQPTNTFHLQAHVDASPNSTSNSQPNPTSSSNANMTFSTSEANKQYCKIFFDTTIVDKGACRIICLLQWNTSKKK